MDSSDAMTIYANDVDYWKTGSKRSATKWIDLTVKQLRDHGATDIVQAVGEQNGRTAFMLQFKLGGEPHRVVWEVLPTRTAAQADDRAAVVQAATSLYHDVKARCVAATRYGDDAGFFQFKMLPDGRTVQDLALPELLDNFGGLLPGVPQRARIEAD